MVDRVKFLEIENPIDVYMFDIQFDKDTFRNGNDDKHKLGSFIIHQSLIDDLSAPKVEDDPLHYMFEWDHDIKSLNGSIPDLLSQYKDALESYLDGDWKFAT